MVDDRTIIGFADARGNVSCEGVKGRRKSAVTRHLIGGVQSGPSRTHDIHT